MDKFVELAKDFSSLVKDYGIICKNLVENPEQEQIFGKKKVKKNLSEKKILKSKLKQIFLKHKLSNKHAEICSNYMIKAEILEAKGHGLARLKMYCDRIKAKVINPKPKL